MEHTEQLEHETPTDSPEMVMTTPPTGENEPSRPSSTTSESKMEQLHENNSDKESEITTTSSNTNTTGSTANNTKDEMDEEKQERPATPDESMELDDKEKRVAESPMSVSAHSDISSASRPNKRKRKGNAPTRHVQQSDGADASNKENADNNDDDPNSEGEFGSAYNEIDRANNRKLLEEFETKSDVIEPTSRPASVTTQSVTVTTATHQVNSTQRQRPQKYGPPRLDLFGPPQHYLDLFGPPVRESTDNCSVVIRGIGEEEIYCGPGDKDPGDMMIPLRTTF